MHPGAVSTKSTVCQEVLFPLESIMLMSFFFFSFCMLFFSEEQLSGFMFMEAREENFSFATELLFINSCPSPSNITASPSPSHPLLRVHIRMLMLPPFSLQPLPRTKFWVTLCVSDVSGVHWCCCHLQCHCTETFWELNFLHATVQMLGCV